MTQKKFFYPVLLTGLFITFILLIIPAGALYGSHTDWLSQHVRIAETIRSACLEQRTLTPAFLPLGGGSNGYQFSYYGYLRPDILIGCLLPRVPMISLMIGYMLAGYLSSVLLCYAWLTARSPDQQEENIPAACPKGFTHGYHNLAVDSGVVKHNAHDNRRNEDHLGDDHGSGRVHEF